ncbi:MAG: dockerin type I repeat-containing protein [Clostridia bacterium]|nr:dockerin type I repeat-containing protein [Clostridia bacterium]
MKKLFSAIAAVMLAASFCINTMAAVNYGDVNGDKKINSSDALMVLMHSTGASLLKGDYKTAADVSGDGKINSTDALLILNYSVGYIKVFPAQDNGNPGIEHDIFG